MERLPYRESTCSRNIFSHQKRTHGQPKSFAAISVNTLPAGQQAGDATTPCGFVSTCVQLKRGILNWSWQRPPSRCRSWHQPTGCYTQGAFSVTDTPLQAKAGGGGRRERERATTWISQGLPPPPRLKSFDVLKAAAFLWRFPHPGLH